MVDEDSDKDKRTRTMITINRNREIHTDITKFPILLPNTLPLGSVSMYHGTIIVLACFIRFIIWHFNTDYSELLNESTVINVELFDKVCYT